MVNFDPQASVRVIVKDQCGNIHAIREVLYPIVDIPRGDVEELAEEMMSGLRHIIVGECEIRIKYF